MDRREFLKTAPLCYGILALSPTSLLASGRQFVSVQTANKTSHPFPEDWKSCLSWDFDCCRDFFRRNYMTVGHGSLVDVVKRFLRYEREIHSVDFLVKTLRPEMKNFDWLQRQFKSLYRDLKAIDVRSDDRVRKFAALMEMEILQILGSRDCHLPVQNLLTRSWDELASDPGLMDMNGRSTRPLHFLSERVDYPKTDEPFLHLRLAVHYWKQAEQGDDSCKTKAIAEFKRCYPYCNHEEKNRMDAAILILSS